MAAPCLGMPRNEYCTKATGKGYWRLVIYPSWGKLFLQHFAVSQSGFDLPKIDYEIQTIGM